MFKKFDGCDSEGEANGVPILINLRSIHTVKPLRYMDHSVNFPHPMVSPPNRVTVLTSKGSNHVIGNFEELTNLLESLTGWYE